MTCGPDTASLPDPVLSAPSARRDGGRRRGLGPVPRSGGLIGARTSASWWPRAQPRSTRALNHAQQHNSDRGPPASVRSSKQSRHACHGGPAHTRPENYGVPPHTPLTCPFLRCGDTETSPPTVRKWYPWPPQQPLPHHPLSLKRIVAASLIGTTIEWYDFFLYGSAAALVFNKLFFPDSDPLVGTLLSFLTYAVGFAARPLGALVFGHYGDRLGRKKLLVLSLLLMGGATFAIGLLPTHATVGVAAPVLLTVLRLVQGFALGGEWGGAVLLVSEHGDAKRRGFWASWPQTGAPAGQLLATGVLSALTALLSDSAFGAWGWRIPFLLSGVLVIVGLWIRLSVDESPVFKAALAQAEARKAAAAAAEKMPLVAVLRHHWRDVLIAMGARMAENISYYVITAFILVYATTAAEPEQADGAERRAHRLRRPLRGHPGVGRAVGPVRPQARLSDRGGRCGAVDVPVLRADRQPAASGACCSPSRSGSSSTGRCTRLRRPSSRRCSRPGCATRVRRSAPSSRRSPPVPRRRSSPPRCSTNYDSSTLISLYVIAAALITVAGGRLCQGDPAPRPRGHRGGTGAGRGPRLCPPTPVPHEHLTV